MKSYEKNVTVKVAITLYILYSETKKPRIVVQHP